MKNIAISFILMLLIGSVSAQEKTIKLNAPSADRGYSMMKSLALRSSSSDFDTTMLNLQDVSDLLWAANGVNRSESSKRTAPSAMNAKDVDVYVVMKKGAYVYDAEKNVLNLVAESDHRTLVAGQQKNVATVPLFCVMISDISRFPGNENSLKMNWAEADAGIVSQNISLFCASVDFATRPRATMDINKLKEVLKLKETQIPILNNPVSYRKK